MAGRRKYFDLRYMFIRGLLLHERMQRGKHYLKSAAECTSKAVVSLELSDKNVNTAKQAARLEAVGLETVRRLEGYVQSGVNSSDRPAPGRYISSAGALLVALLNLTEVAAADSQNGVVLIAEEDLRSEAAKLSDEPFLPKQSAGFCQAWWRLEVLIKRDLVKRRSLHKANVYHLLPLGMEAAVSLRVRNLGQDDPAPGLAKPPESPSSRASSTATPKPRKRKVKAEMAGPESPSSRASTTPKPRKRKVKAETAGPTEKKVSRPAPSATTSKPSTTASSSPPLSSSVSATSGSAEDPAQHVLTDAMYSNDTGKDGVVLLVDTQECGGNRAGLGELCELIEQTGTVYRTRKLPCADYSWLWRCEGVDRPLPFLLERKRADDVAFSLKDGRFWGQISKMTSQKEEFLQKGLEAKLQYVIEGKPEKFVVRCADGCQGVGRCGNPTLQQVERVLVDLQQHPQLEVIRVDSLLDTVRHLAAISTQLKHRTERGEFDSLVIAEMAAETVAPHHLTKNTVKSEQPVLVTSDDDDDKDDVQFISDNATEVKTSGQQRHETKEAEQHLYRGYHSASPVLADRDESPPLLPTSLAAVGQTGVNKTIRSVGQGANRPAAAGKEGSSPVRLYTSSGSPRGRVYLMKRLGGQPNTSPSASKSKALSLDCCKTTTAEGPSDKQPGLAVKGSQWLLAQGDGDGKNDSASLSGGVGGSSSPGGPGQFPEPLSLHPDDFTISRNSTSPFAEHDRHFAASMPVGEESEVLDPVNDCFPISKQESFSTVNKSLTPYTANSSTTTAMDSCSFAAKERKDSARVVAEEDFSLALRCRGGKKTGGQTFHHSPDGSDSEDSDSLPDIDFGLCPSQHSSLKASSQSPNDPCLFPENRQQGQMTQWHEGNNSQEEASSGAPRQPHNSKIDVQTDDKIAQIAAVFPQMTSSQIAEALHHHDGNVERCVIAILEQPWLMERQSATTATATITTTANIGTTPNATDTVSTCTMIDLTE